MLALRKWVLSLAILSALTTGPAPSAQAALLLDLNTGGSAQPCAGCGSNGTTLGWSFTVLNPVTIDGLGLWDAGANGIGTTSQVGLWTNGGVLLASATVTNTSTQVASASSDGAWLFESIAATTLAAGNYRIGALFFDGLPPAQTNAPFVTDPNISLIGGILGPLDSGFAAPLDAFGIRIFGPTMRLGEAVVPEPATLALLGTGLLGLAWSRRRRAA